MTKTAVSVKQSRIRVVESILKVYSAEKLGQRKWDRIEGKRAFCKKVTEQDERD